MDGPCVAVIDIELGLCPPLTPTPIPPHLIFAWLDHVPVTHVPVTHVPATHVP